MAASSGSLDTTGNFSFSTSFMMPTSFTDLLSSSDDCSLGFSSISASSKGLGDRIAQRTGSGVPKFKSLPPPSLPISPPSAVSPSSYFAIPPGLSPTELLDSPVLLSASSILPSPTTGTFPVQAYDWKNNSRNCEVKNHSDFSFQPQSSFAAISGNVNIPSGQMQYQSWNYEEEPTKGKIHFTEKVPSLKSDFNSLQSFSPEIVSIQSNRDGGVVGFQSENNHYNQSSQTMSDRRRSEDGYNWRKYGQKQVKGSENPRSYYKCTYPNCPTKKKVEKSIGGQITEIVYKGNHNHPKPQSSRRTSSSSSASSVVIQAYNSRTTNDMGDQSYGSTGTGQIDSVATPENSSISVGDDDLEQSSQKTSTRSGEDFDEDEPDAKRWRKELENESVSAAGNRTVREPRVVVQTTSDIDILDDGYRWRKYGQKVVKGNPNPRSYYKCTSSGCQVRKHVERASHDMRAVITTYEGKHNHDVPAARGSHSVTRPMPMSISDSNNYRIPARGIIRPTSTADNANANSNSRDETIREFTLEMMLQNHPSTRGGGGGYGNSSSHSLSSYMNSNMEKNNNNNTYTKTTKEEPREDRFLESLLC